MALLKYIEYFLFLNYAFVRIFIRKSTIIFLTTTCTCHIIILSRALSDQLYMSLASLALSPSYGCNISRTEASDVSGTHRPT
jgi:hypothetical protein